MVIPKTITDVPLRVLLFLPDLDGGGAQRTLVNLANALPRDRIEPILVSARTDGYGKDWVAADVPLCDLMTRRLRGSLRPLRRIIRHYQPKVLLSTIADANVIAYLAIQGLTTPPKLILRETNSHRMRDDIGLIRRSLIKFAYRRADAVVALSDGVRREIIADHKLDPQRTYTLSNPVNVKEIANSVEKVRGEEPPISKTGPLIVSIGRLSRQKGFDLLLDAFSRIGDKEARLVILGEGEERSCLELMARNLGVANRVIFPGFIDNVALWLAYADLFVLSSRWEGFGHVIVEAMAAGVPVVATDCPYGPREIIRDGKTGLLVQPDDACMLSSTIDRVLSDSALRQALSIAAVADCGNYSVEIVAENYAKLFHKIVSANG